MELGRSLRVGRIDNSEGIVNWGSKIEGGLRFRGTTKVCSPAGPLVSVITVVLNGIRSIERAIDSVRRQTYPNVEYIVVDGGSTDGTVQALREYDNVIDYWCSEPDRGIYDAWNKGIALSSGGWIGFLGADDAYYEDAIENYVRKIQTHQDSTLQYVSGRVEFVLPDRAARRIIGSPWNWKMFRKYMNVAHVGSLHNRSLFEMYGAYDTNYKMCGDYELLLRAKGQLKADFVDAITATMYGGGISNRTLKVFDESMKAKVQTGGRNRILGTLEKYTAIARYVARGSVYRCRQVFEKLRG